VYGMVKNNAVRWVDVLGLCEVGKTGNYRFEITTTATNIPPAADEAAKIAASELMGKLGATVGAAVGGASGAAVGNEIGSTIGEHAKESLERAMQASSNSAGITNATFYTRCNYDTCTKFCRWFTIWATENPAWQIIRGALTVSTSQSATSSTEEEFQRLSEELRRRKAECDAKSMPATQ
jgi:hypothetical protein